MTTPKIDLLIEEVDRLKIAFEKCAQESPEIPARVAAQAATNLHGILMRWYGRDRFQFVVYDE